MSWSTRSVRVRLAFAVSISIASIAPISGQEMNYCPDRLANQHSTPPYQFGYQSWHWETKSAVWEFCNCIRNRGDEMLFVSWEEAGLRTYARPKAPYYTLKQFPDGNARTIKSDLWYGAAPDRLETDLTVYAGFGGIEPSTAAEPSTNESHAPALKSRTKVVIPSYRLARWSMGNPKVVLELSRFLDTDEFVDVTFEFDSSPVYEGNDLVGVEQVCSYTFEVGERSGINDGGEMALVIKDQALHETVFGTPYPQHYSIGREPLTFAGKSEIDQDPTTDLVIRASSVEIVDTEWDYTIAEMPFTYYSK